MLLRDRLPSNQSLIVFESAGRLLGFTAAAKELGSTQSAVSQLMRNLEQNLALTLFERVHRGIELTAAGKQLLSIVQLNLNDIANGIEKLQLAQKKPVLNVAMDYAFAAYWLLPRLDDYRAQHPDVEVRVISEQEVTVDANADIDIAIFFADSLPANAMLLFKEQVYPVCSSSFYEKVGAIKSHKILASLPLLKLTDRANSKWLDWERFFAGRRSKVKPIDSVMAFNNYTLLIQSAIAGQGVGLGWDGLVDEMVERGMLVALKEFKLDSNAGYYAIQPSIKRKPASEQFITWLASQIANELD
jgi:putative choline sulfate-utilization transcription factor